MENPFKTDGLAWAHGKGMFLFDGTSFPIDEKPILTFNFSALYCEPTLVKRVVNGKDYELTDEEIKEVQNYIAEAKVKPHIVNGVDPDGKFLMDVERAKVSRVVYTRPPEEYGLWRLDPNTLFEQWVQVYAIDSEGYLMDSGGIVDESQAFQIIKTPLPTDKKYYRVRKWKWDHLADQWVDGELYENKIKTLQERKIEEFQVAKSVDAAATEVDFKGKVYHGNTKSLETLVMAVTLGLTTLDWYPKDALVPEKLNPKDMKDLATLIFDKQQQHTKKLVDKKTQVLTTLDEDEIANITW
jgi:hypothetical protein